ncbi:hypothetical protein GGI00_000322 [Coemansia sp. RSA 2681]|nr:hypothetical protein GGI00_000322 [Coemansia sp. RSA 2681]KAJ2443902.1 hypothetical protein GGF42_006484 [Coemansia sp. RSA 2424]
MAEQRTVSPSESDLQAAIAAVKASSPELGIARVCATLREGNSTWQLSEKRVRKLMIALGLVQSSGTDPADPGAPKKDSATSSVPKSYVAPGDFVRTLGKGQVEVKYINGTKGKGVFASKAFGKGENIFEETPFAWYPRWDTVSVSYHTKSDAECQLCARTVERSLHADRGLMRPVKCSRCPAWFCSNLCKKEAEAKFHQIECSKHNSHFASLANVCRAWEWGAPMGAARAIERVLMEYEHSTERGKAAWESIRAFATVPTDIMDKKRKGMSWFLYEADYETKWKTTYELMKKALCPPPEECGLAKFSCIPKKIRDELFSYSEWLNLIGKYCLNDQNGGFYLLQSCFNHNCDPNCVVVHPNDGKYRAIIQTLRPITAGEEMSITYVNPRDGVAARQEALHDWYMFDCQCERCVKELASS